MTKTNCLIVIIVALLTFCLLTIAECTEINVPLYQEDGATHTFVAVHNPIYLGLWMEITLRDSNAIVVYNERKYVVGGGTWFFNTENKAIPSLGSINIFVEDSSSVPVNVAVTAMLYGSSNIGLQATRY
jgi:hypothetical protein